MPWVKATFNGQRGNQEVWAEVDEAGRLVNAGGRVPIRYRGTAGEKIYSGGLDKLALIAGQAAIELPPGEAAPPSGGGASPGRSSGRGSGFGSAGTRTAAQATAAKAHFQGVLDGIAPEAAVCFTDGACKGNPGPCGAGAVVKLPDGRVLESYKALGVGTNNVGELTAIGLALDLLDQAAFPADQPVRMFTDSQYAEGVLVKGWKAKANQEIIAALKPRLKARKLSLGWLAGHVGIAENERADVLANQGVAESSRRR